MDLNIRFGGHTELCKAFDPLSWHHGGSDSHHVCQVGPENSGEVGRWGQQRTDVMTEWTCPTHVRNGTHCIAVSKNIRDLNERLFFFLNAALLFSCSTHHQHHVYGRI